MLPGSAGSSRPSFNSALIPEYLWRLVNFRQMDIDFAISQLVDLLLRPSEISKTTKIRKQIKNQWARDDPAFVLILMALILISTAAYCIAFATSNPLHILRLLVGGIVFEFLILGSLVVSGIRWYLNKNMRIQRLHTVEQSIEWLYAFDVHCNALFASFLLVSSAQYFLIPVLLSYSFFATALANSLWLAGVAYYAYITFLGYSALPFIDRPERLFYPMGFVCLLYFLLLLSNFNMSRFLLDLYFGHSHASLEELTTESYPL